MTQRMGYYCDDCGEHINSKPNPIVLYIVAGHVNGGGEIDHGALHPGVAELLRQDVARRDFCSDCFPAAMQQMIDTPRPAATPEPVPEPVPEAPEATALPEPK